eukprot:g7027.t1
MRPAQDRKRALQESIQQAREFEVLDIFRSQHPWLNATRNDLSLQMSMALSLYSASMEGGPKVRPRSAVKRCVPSPRSVQDSEPDLHEGSGSVRWVSWPRDGGSRRGRLFLTIWRVLPVAGVLPHRR